MAPPGSKEGVLGVDGVEKGAPCGMNGPLRGENCWVLCGENGVLTLAVLGPGASVCSGAKGRPAAGLDCGGGAEGRKLNGVFCAVSGVGSRVMSCMLGKAEWGCSSESGAWNACCTPCPCTAATTVL